MIKPIHFKYNDESAQNNYFQHKLSMSAEEAQTEALDEFEALVSKLRKKGIEVIVLLDNEDYNTPDSIFPNNWISFHEDGKVGIYPMFAQNRRLERREDISDFLELKGYKVSKKIDLTEWESKNKFLEGTGSLVLDRENKIAYAALSERTDSEVLQDFEEKFGYTSFSFNAFHDADGIRVPIYHTNVMMSIGDDFCVICLNAIDDEAQKNEVILSLTSTGKEIIEITEEQLGEFAGNMLQVRNDKEEKFMVMSYAAFDSLTDGQKEELLKYNDEIIPASLNTIESLGGGSARCMMAEVFLQRVGGL